MKASQIITCGSLDLFLSSLQQVRPDSTVCVVSCMAHFLASTDGPSTISLRLDPILQVRILMIDLRFCLAFRIA